METGSVNLPPGLVRAQSNAKSEPFGVRVASLRAESNSSDGPFGQQVSALRADIKAADSVQLGANPPSTNDGLNIVLERAFEQLRQVVGDAREALGLPEGSAFDTSADATANRIADFALGAFGAFQDNHPELGEEEVKGAFVDLIGGAIAQGIEEARGILEALSALNPEVQNNISTIEGVIQQRLDAFLGGE